MKRKDLLKCIKIKDSSVTISPPLPPGVRRPMIIKQQTELPKSAKEARVLAKQYHVSNWWNLSKEEIINQLTSKNVIPETLRPRRHRIGVPNPKAILTEIFNRRRLNDLAKQWHVKNFYRMNKSELINELVNRRIIMTPFNEKFKITETKSALRGVAKDILLKIEKVMILKLL